MNLKTYINDKFMMYCFENGFRTAVAKIGLELKTIKIEDFVHQDLTSNEPGAIIEANNKVLESYKQLSSRTISQWFQIFQGKITGYHAQQRFFNQIKESEGIKQLEEQDLNIYFENFLIRTLKNAEKLLRNIDIKIDDLETDSHIETSRDLVLMLRDWFSIGQNFICVGIEDYGIEVREYVSNNL